MKHLNVLSILAMIFALSGVGCSEQWREGETDRSADEVNQMLSEAMQSSGGSNFNNNITDGAWVYFADTSGSQGNVVSVLALENLNFLGGQQNLSYLNVREARVFYVDQFTEEAGHQVILIIGVDTTGGGTFEYHSLSGTAVVENGLYEAVLTGSNGNTVTVRSWDVEGDALVDVIQLKFFESYSNGEEHYLGKVSSLVGFAP